MICHHKNDTQKRNLSSLEKSKMKKLRRTKPTAWMV